MKIPHFFKVKTRLGLIAPPNTKKELNIGVEDAASFILDSEFLSRYNNSKVHEYTFSLPENIDKSKIDSILAKESDGFREMLALEVKANEVQVVVGGDHSVTFPSFLAVEERLEDISKIGYIQFDSHGDMNLLKDSPTGNFHGMYVRPFIDEAFDMPEVKSLVKRVISPKQLLFIGNMDLDTNEKIFFEEKGVENITTDIIREKKEEIETRVSQFVNSFDHIHITIDIDVFDKSIALATGIPAENGFLLKDVMGILEILSEHPSKSIDLSEINPKKDGAKETIILSQTILKKLL